MGKILLFPKTNASQKFRSLLHGHSVAVPEDSCLGIFDSAREEQCFLEFLKEWPCFQQTAYEESLSDIFDRYYDDDLSLAQDCVLEFMLQLKDPDSIFDITNALYTWSEDDRDFFFFCLSLHAEMLDSCKEQDEIYDDDEE